MSQYRHAGRNMYDNEPSQREREVNDSRHYFAINLCGTGALRNLSNRQTQSVKASYAQSVRSLPSSLTEAFSTLLRFEKTETW